MATIGFIGLGRMGIPMSTQLIAAGHSVYGYDRSAAARARLEERGGHATASLAGAVLGDIVILMLPDSPAVASVIEDPGFSAALRTGAIIIDMSSSEPAVTRRLASQLMPRGVKLIDAPVSGGVKGAEDGTLTVMVGARDADFAQIAPLLAPLGRVVHAGGVGCGHAIKALNNLLSATHLLATSEAMRVGQKFGLDPNTMLEIINSSSGRSGSTEVKWPRYVLNDQFNSGFSLRLMLKDVRIAVQLGENVGSPMTLGRETQALWERAAAALPEVADHTRVATWTEPDPRTAKAAAGSNR